MLLDSTSEGCLLVVRNEWNQRKQRYEAKPNLGKKCAIDLRAKENHDFQPLSDKPQGGIS